MSPRALTRRAALLWVIGCAAATACAGREALTSAQRLDCLRGGLHSSERARQEAALEDLGQLGARAEPVVADLGQLLLQQHADVEFARQIIDALTHIGPAAATALATVATAAIAQVELDGAGRAFFAALGSAADARAVSLLGAHGDGRVRRLIAEWLGDSRVIAGATNDALIATLEREPQQTVREAVAGALGRRGAAAAAPVLARALRDTHFSVAHAAAVALTRLGAPGAELLARELRGDHLVAILAAAAVTAQIPLDERLLQRVRGGLRHGAVELRVAAVRAIAKMGAGAVQRTRDEIATLLTDSEGEAQAAAEEALRLIDRP